MYTLLLLFLDTVPDNLDSTFNHSIIEEVSTELEIWCLTPLSTIFRGDYFYWCREPEYPVENHRPAQVTDKFYHIILYQVHA